MAKGGLAPYPQAYERLKRHVVHLHVKDAAACGPQGEIKNVPFGQGEIDWAGQLEALVADGYVGYISLETHWRQQELSREQLRGSGGARF